MRRMLGAISLLVLTFTAAAHGDELRTFHGKVAISEAGEVEARDEERDVVVVLENGPAWLADERIREGSDITAQYDPRTVERSHGGKGKGHLIDAAE